MDSFVFSDLPQYNDPELAPSKCIWGVSTGIKKKILFKQSSDDTFMKDMQQYGCYFKELLDSDSRKDSNPPSNEFTKPPTKLFNIWKEEDLNVLCTVMKSNISKKVDWLEVSSIVKTKSSQDCQKQWKMMTSMTKEKKVKLLKQYLTFGSQWKKYEDKFPGKRNFALEYVFFQTILQYIPKADLKIPEKYISYTLEKLQSSPKAKRREKANFRKGKKISLKRVLNAKSQNIKQNKINSVENQITDTPINSTDQEPSSIQNRSDLISSIDQAIIQMKQQICDLMKTVHILQGQSSQNQFQLPLHASHIPEISRKFTSEEKYDELEMSKSNQFCPFNKQEDDIESMLTFSTKPSISCLSRSESGEYEYLKSGIETNFDV